MADVLVIDDDRDSSEVVVRYLRKAGHAARSAADGREALRALVAAVPDVIVLDLLMPGMDGVTLLEVVRSYLRWTFVPVVILTACPEDPRLQSLASLGVTRVFAKAKFDLADLLAFVNACHRRDAGRRVVVGS